MQGKNKNKIKFGFCFKLESSGIRKYQSEKEIFEDLFFLFSINSSFENNHDFEFAFFRGIFCDVNVTNRAPIHTCEGQFNIHCLIATTITRITF